MKRIIAGLIILFTFWIFYACRSGELVFYAIRYQPTPVCKLVFSVCKLDVRSEYGTSPIFDCIHLHRIELVKYLMRHVHEQLFRKWMKSKANMGRTILQTGECMPTELLEQFIEYGAPVNTDRDSGMTPLEKCIDTSSMCSHGIQNVLLLLKKGADVNAQNSKGNTPLHIAARISTDPRLITALVEAGSDVNAKNYNGETPLWQATLLAASNSPQLSVIRKLLSYGADPFIIPTEGKYRGIRLSDAIQNVLQNKEYMERGPISGQESIWAEILSMINRNNSGHDTK